MESSTNSLDPNVSAGVLVGTLVVALVLYVVFAIFLSMIFKKAGVEGWKAWVPVYSSWVFLELGGQKGWLSLLPLTGLIPVLGLVVGPIAGLVSFVFMCIAAYQIGLNFGKSGAFVLLYILLTPVWLIWLAVDASTWKGAAAPTVQAVPAGPPQVSAPEASTTVDESENTAPANTPVSSAEESDSTKPPTSSNVQ